jgi:hypothetical protein
MGQAPIFFAIFAACENVTVGIFLEHKWVTGKWGLTPQKGKKPKTPLISSK